MQIFFFALPAVIAAAISYALTPAARRVAERFGAIDYPGPRKIHARPIPRLGGLAVVISLAVVLGFLCLFRVPAKVHLPHDLCAGLALGFLPILIASLWDDIRPIPAAPKFAAQFLGAAIAIAFGIRLGPVVHLFGYEIQLGVLSIAISFLWIVGVTNAFNLVDGLDGLSAGLALISSLSLAAVAMVGSMYGMAAGSLVLSGALIGFLPYNVYPARVFLGDTGATAIGFCLACLALRGGSTLSAGMAVLIPIFALGVPVAETLISMVRRFLRGVGQPAARGMFQADGEHFHHRLLALGFDHRKAVLMLYAVGLLVAGLGILSLFLTRQSTALILVTLLCASFIGVARLGYNEFALIRRGVVLRFYEAPMLKWALFPVFVDLGVAVLSLYGGLVFKFDDWGVTLHRPLALYLVAVIPALTLVTFLSFRLYRGSWRFASLEDLVRSTFAVVTATVASGVLCRLTFDSPPPATFFATFGLIFLALVNGSRASYRLLTHWRNRAVAAGAHVLIYGAGVAGTTALREMLSNPELELDPVGFLDDNPLLAGKYTNGLPVLGSLETLEQQIRTRTIECLVIASEKIGVEKTARAVQICSAAGVVVRTFRIDFASEGTDHPNGRRLRDPSVRSG